MKFPGVKLCGGESPYSTFYPAEEDHQDFYKKKPERYRSYAVGSGRVGFLEEKWGK